MSGWAWLAAIGGGVLVVLLWVEYQSTPDDTSWTDPSQPPPMVAPVLGSGGGRPMRGSAYCRSYPASLAAWPETVVGDC